MGAACATVDKAFFTRGFSVFLVKIGFDMLVPLD
jgi:hypothetical protein